MPITNLGVSNNVPLQLKNGVDKQEFKQNVNNVLQNDKLNKADYKQLKDSMVNGRQSLNEVLSQVGIASKDDLGKIFAKKKNDGSVEVNPLQKSLINSIISDKVDLSPEAQKDIEEIKSFVKPHADRSDISKRYSFKDCAYSPEIKSAFKAHCEKEHTVENLNFMNDVKTLVENPDMDSLDNLYNQYMKDNAKSEINISSNLRYGMAAIFENPQSTMEDKLSALKYPVMEINTLISGQIFNRFKANGIQNALTLDMQALPPGPERQNYFKQFMGTPLEKAAKTAIQDDFKRVLNDANI